MNEVMAYVARKRSCRVFSIDFARLVPLYFATSSYFVPLETMILRLTIGTSCWKKIHITLRS